MVLTTNKNPIFLLLMLVVGCGIFAFYGVKSESRGHQLRVVSYNVGTLNGEKPALKRIVDAIEKKGRPGLVLVQEVPDEAFLLAIGERLGLRHHAFGAYTAGGSGYGLGLLSERPLLNSEMHLLKPNGHAVLMAEMRSEKNRVLVCSAHLEWLNKREEDEWMIRMNWMDEWMSLAEMEWKDGGGRDSPVAGVETI